MDQKKPIRDGRRKLIESVKLLVEMDKRLTEVARRWGVDVAAAHKSYDELMHAFIEVPAELTAELFDAAGIPQPQAEDSDDVDRWAAGVIYAIAVGMHFKMQ